MAMSFSNLVKVSWIQLTPFIKCVAVYFVLLSFEFFKSQVLSTILKCLPIFCLMAFIFLMGYKFSSEYRFHTKILLGLLFSSCGDALLDYKKADLFPFGMIAFAVAHFFYISGFGWKPLRSWVAALLFAFGGVAVYLMFEKFDPILKIGVPVYGVILLTMAWRAISRIQSPSNLPKILCAIGAVLFVVSDSLIAFSMFYSPIKYSKVLIMSTYYAGQLGIALSILDPEMKVLPKKTVKSN